jgi:hypothetical protein
MLTSAEYNFWVRQIETFGSGRFKGCANNLSTQSQLIAYFGGLTLDTYLLVKVTR